MRIPARLLTAGLPALALLLLSACGGEGPAADPAETLSEDRLHEHIAELASDEYQGRAPATEGGRKTVDYLTAHLQEMLLTPSNQGSYTQEVPLVEITLDPDVRLELAGEDHERSLSYGEEMMIWSPRQQEEIEVSDSELVFVGYGTVAPEYDWDDYRDLDLEGKTVVMLVNDPGFATGEEALFNGNAMTYYGRWTYKFEEAARQGATGALLIHEDDAAGYGWDVVSGSWSGPQFALDSESDEPLLDLEGWITREVAESLFEAAGKDFDAMKAAALEEDFEPVSLETRASTRMRNRFEHSSSENVIAHIPGSKRPDEYIVYMAHWDHLGVDPEDDSIIFNGAVDNASGTAAVLELARAFSEMETPPERSIVFLFVTAEEQGLLGSQYYAENPVFPLEQTVAGINLDSMNHIGPTHDITVVGYGSSELEDYLARAADEEDRHLRPEPHPERGYFFRSDHFSFARHGVPVLYPNPGIDHVEHGEEYGRERSQEYQNERYHRPADEYDPEWDLSGLLADTRLLLRVGLMLAETEAFPNWHEDSEFRAIRDESRQADSDR